MLLGGALALASTLLITVWDDVAPVEAAATPSSELLS